MFKRIAIAAILAVSLAGIAAEAYAQQRTCSTTCYGNTCTTRCY